MLCPCLCPHSQGSSTDGGRAAGVQGLLKAACGQGRGRWLCWGGKEGLRLHRGTAQGSTFETSFLLPNIPDEGLTGRGECLRYTSLCLLGPRGVNLLFSRFRTVKILSGF